MKYFFLSILVVFAFILTGCRTAAQKESERALDAMILDEILFRDAPVTEAIRALNDFAGELNPDKTVLEYKADNPTIMFSEPF